MPPGSSHTTLPARIAITGATGLVGAALTKALRSDGVQVHRLVRGAPREAGDVTWDPANGRMDAEALAGVEAIVNLAGEPIAQRWNGDVKRRIRASRVDGTAALVRAMGTLPVPPRILLSASAVGIYGDRGDEVLDEQAAPGRDWLAGVAREWEDAALSAAGTATRVAVLRTGVVLSPRGGALARLLPPFRLGLGGPLADGNQWMSWIALTDLVAAIQFVLRAPALEGPINLVAPEPVRNREFTRVLGHVLHRPAVIPVPRLALHVAFGEMADATLLASQRVIPGKLHDAGYRFRFPDLEPALRHELRDAVA